MLIDTVNIVTFDLHELILCVSEGLTSNLLDYHNVGMGTFVLRELTLCVSEGHFSVLLSIHNVGM